MAEDMGEKSEAPTSKRLSDARQKGQIARSQDLSAAVDMIGGALLILFFGGAIVKAAMGIMLRVFDTAGQPFTLDDVQPLLRDAALKVAMAVAPVLGLIVVVAICAQVMQVGFLLTTSTLEPKPERLNPVKGLKNLLSTKNLVKSVVNTVKLIVVIVVSYLFIGGMLDRLAALPGLTMIAGLRLLGEMAVELLAWLLALLLVIGVIDYLYQRFQHTKDLKMTKDEVKDERRSMDGDPMLKAKRLKMARDIAMHRIQQSVPQADVIVTNPTHFSVALRYDAATMRAPIVVAKGADLLAFRIRQVAMIHRVPIVERPPLARGLYWGVEVGQEIAPEFYEAVAELLAFVYRLEKEAAA